MKKILLVGKKPSQPPFGPECEEQNQMNIGYGSVLESPIIYYAAGPNQMKDSIITQKPLYSA
jgi:hypothetical protein